jgi:tripartite-type tricarboxylate transporter receptor subunit TctC
MGQPVVAFAQSQPGKLRYGSPGVGSAHHLVGELFNSREIEQTTKLIEQTGMKAE